MPYAEAVTDAIHHPWVDDRGAPIYVWRIPPGPSTQDLSEALAAIRLWVPTLDGPYGWINDTRELSATVVASQRKLLTDHLSLVEPFAQRWCAGMATVVTNQAVRGVGTAIEWMVPHKWPTGYFTTIREAWPWVHGQLANKGVRAMLTPAPGLTEV